MKDFAQLQNQFQAFVESGARGIETSVIDGPRAGASVRLNIYAEAYRSRLIEVLEADFPALKALAGDALFERIALAYIDRHPSDRPNARWFGRHLLSFLMDQEPFASQPVLAEMAGFEWAMSLAFDAPDEPVLAMADLAAVPGESWPHLAFTMHPALQQIDLRWNVPAFWLAVQREEDPPRPVMSTEAMPWIVWRRDLTTFYRSLEADESEMLDAACGGATFAGLCESLLGRHAEEAVPMRAIELLKRWIDEGFVLGCQVRA